jgi:hypothetical protein
VASISCSADGFSALTAGFTCGVFGGLFQLINHPLPALHSLLLFSFRVFLSGLSPYIPFASFISKERPLPGTAFSYNYKGFLCIVRVSFIVCTSFISFNTHPLHSIVVVFADSLLLFLSRGRPEAAVTSSLVWHHFKQQLHATTPDFGSSVIASVHLHNITRHRVVKRIR